VNLAGLDGQIDVVIGDQGAKPFGNAAKFEFHSSPVSICRA
jgi:hypothetical protein